MPFDLVCPVWGSLYIDRFLRYTLASLLAPANLPQWPYHSQTIFCCYTTAADREQLLQNPSWHLLAHYLMVEWRALPDPLPNNPYHILSLVEQDALLQAQARQHGLIFIFPDHVYSAHTLAFLAQAIAQQQTLVLYPGLRVKEVPTAKFLEHYRQGLFLELDETTTIDCLIEHLHPECRGYFWYAEQFNIHGPSAAYYWQDNQTFCGHHYDLNPLYIEDPQPMPARDHVPFPTLDVHYVDLLDDWVKEPQQMTQVAIPRHSEMVSLSLTPNTYQITDWVAPLPYYQRPRHVLPYLQRLYHSPFKQWCFQQTLSFRSKSELAPAHPKEDAPFTLYQAMAPYSPWLIPATLIELETLALAADYNGLITDWQTPAVQERLNAITDVMLAGFYYPIAVALYHLGHMTELDTWIAERREFYRQADFSTLRFRPAYWGYLPDPDGATDLPPSPYHLLLWPQIPLDQGLLSLMSQGPWWILGSHEPARPADWPPNIQLKNPDNWPPGSSLSQLYTWLAQADRVVFPAQEPALWVDMILYRLLRGQSVEYLGREYGLESQTDQNQAAKQFGPFPQMGSQTFTPQSPKQSQPKRSKTHQQSSLPPNHL